MSVLVEYIKQFARFQRNARLYLISNALSGVTVGIILVLYNLYIVSLGYDTAFVGFMLSVATLGAGLGIFPAGLCFDRLGGKLILIWGSVALSIAGMGQLLLRDPLPLLLSGFIAGVAGAFILVVNAPFLTHNSTVTERSVLFSLNIVLLLIPTVLGKLIGGMLPLWFSSTPWLMARLPFWLDGLLASQPLARSYQLTMLFAGIMAVPSFIPLFLMDDDCPLRSSSSGPTGKMPLNVQRWREKALVAVQRWQNIPLRASLSSPIATLVIVQALIGLGAGLFIPYFNVYFVKALAASPALFGTIDGAATTIDALLILLAPWLAARIGQINTITITRLLALPLLLTIGLSHLLPLVAVLYLFRQGMMGMATGIFQVFSMEAIVKPHRGFANSVYQIVSQGSWAVTAPLGGLIIARMGYTPIFLIGAIFYLAAIVLLWVRFGRGVGERLAMQNEKGS
ncbi:MAG: MFS transporter [Chloroflexi bacterium]|nr:MAG: MFS transporter [Chloroflexota bacterium]